MAAQAKTLFLNASDLSDPAERAAYLDRECGDDAKLRARVEVLLRANDASPLPPLAREDATLDSGPEQPAKRATAVHTPKPDLDPFFDSITVDHDTTALPDVLIAGRYTLQQKIGEGGMGEVWVAKQSEPVKRKVALKLIKTGMDSRAVLQRFEQERQALAMMDHPNIAKVLDAGLTPTGQPFFVMELVNGLALTKFCDEARLTPRERLELFVPICQAVQHAHQKGIVHRDLKPANILVTLIDGKPVPKVIDFGVAKATAGKLTDDSMSTQFGAVVGTMEYMSPEQAGFSGVDIDTRADIYSLGVMLYELLTGLKPIDGKRLRKAALSEMVRIIREEEPPRPSTRLSTDGSLPSIAALRQIEPRKLIDMLRGELDWVVMKCLEKNRDRRYETANGLARDIQRYLTDEPVEARPPSARYRLSKFLKRNKGPVIAAGSLLLALMCGVAGTTLGMIRADRRRVEADQARGREADLRVKAEKARDRTLEAFDAMTSIDVTDTYLTNQQEISAEQKRFLTRVLSYYQEFAAEKADDESSRASTALAASRVGFIEARLGRSTEAVSAFRLAIDGQTTLAAEFPSKPLYRARLAVSHSMLGDELSTLGKRAEAEEHFRKALPVLEKLVADFPAEPLYRDLVAVQSFNLGILLTHLGRLTEAEEQFRNSLAVREKLISDFPAVRRYNFGLGHSYGQLGMLLKNVGKRREAEDQYRKTLTIDEKLVADFPADPIYRNKLADDHYRLGLLLTSLRNSSEAEEQHRKSLAIREKLVADFPVSPHYREGLVRDYGTLEILQWNLGKRADAEEQARKSLAVAEKLTTDFPTIPRYRSLLASQNYSLGFVLAGLEKRSQAEEPYRKALDIQQKLVAEFPAEPEYRGGLAQIYESLGRFLTDQSKRQDAEELFRRALRVREKLTADFPLVPEYLNDLADHYRDLGTVLKSPGDREKAEELGRKALTIRQKLVADFPAMPHYRELLAGHYRDRGAVLSGQGKRPEAEEQYRNALAIQEKLVADFPKVPDYLDDLANNYCDLGLVLKNLGNLSEAEELAQKATASREKLVAAFPALSQYRELLAGHYLYLARGLKEMGKWPEAEELARKALAVREKLVADFPAVPKHRDDLAQAYLTSGRTREAVPLLATASSANPWDTELSLKVAALQAWFGEDKELAATRQRILTFALGTNDVQRAERAAKACSIRPSANTAELEAALVLGRRAVDLGKTHEYLPFYQMALGMAEFRAGNFAAADQALLAAAETGKNYPQTTINAAFYRAMNLFKQGKHGAARELAAATAAKMKPLPADEKNPLASATGNSHDDLILWMAYKEAKGLIGFDVPLPSQARLQPFRPPRLTESAMPSGPL